LNHVEAGREQQMKSFLKRWIITTLAVLIAIHIVKGINPTSRIRGVI
jgi:hypothetical protein